MKGTARDRIGNEKGFVLVVALLMVAVITIIGIAATRTSETEIRISVNERGYINEFYNAEGALIDTLERPTNWLTGSMLQIGVAGAYTDSDLDDDGERDNYIEIRRIFDHTQLKESPLAVQTVPGLSDAANHVPQQSHTGSPPAGSGYSMKHFEVRRYGVTATSETGNTQVQTGVWKIFNIQ